MTLSLTFDIDFASAWTLSPDADLSVTLLCVNVLFTTCLGTFSQCCVAL